MKVVTKSKNRWYDKSVLNYNDFSISNGFGYDYSLKSYNPIYETMVMLIISISSIILLSTFLREVDSLGGIYGFSYFAILGTTIIIPLVSISQHLFKLKPLIRLWWKLHNRSGFIIKEKSNDQFIFTSYVKTQLEEYFIETEFSIGNIEDIDNIVGDIDRFIEERSWHLDLHNKLILSDEEKYNKVLSQNNYQRLLKESLK